MFIGDKPLLANSRDIKSNCWRTSGTSFYALCSYNTDFKIPAFEIGGIKEAIKLGISSLAIYPKSLDCPYKLFIISPCISNIWSIPKNDAAIEFANSSFPTSLANLLTLF